MIILKRIAIFGLHLAGTKSAPKVVLYFRNKADAIQYQKAHYQNMPAVIKELDAIEVNGAIKQFHYRPSAARHSFGAYLLNDDLRAAIMNQPTAVLVGLNRPYPNKRIAGSPDSMREAKHFIWCEKIKNELVIKDAKLLNKPIVFADQQSLKQIQAFTV